jgi:energy-coupling factor transport system substrate-specific component
VNSNRSPSDPRSPAGARADTRWRTRDIVVAAVLSVAFGVFFWAFGVAWSGLAVLGPAQNLLYGVWLLPAIVVPLVIRKPGAAFFAETVAAALSALLGAQWGIDTLLSGVMQGAAAEAAFALGRYRRYDLPIIVAASLASMAAAFLHDWVFYFQATSADVLAVIALLMALSGLFLLPAAAIALERSLRRTGVLAGFGR